MRLDGAWSAEVAAILRRGSSLTVDEMRDCLGVHRAVKLHGKALSCYEWYCLALVRRCMVLLRHHRSKDFLNSFFLDGAVPTMQLG